MRSSVAEANERTYVRYVRVGVCVFTGIRTIIRRALARRLVKAVVYCSRIITSRPSLFFPNNVGPFAVSLSLSLRFFVVFCPFSRPGLSLGHTRSRNVIRASAFSRLEIETPSCLFSRVRAKPKVNEVNPRRARERR